MTNAAIRLLVLALSLLGAFALAGCAPVNAAGNWSVNLTNGANGCSFANWTPGETTSALPVTITQSGSDVTAEVTGLSGGLVEAAFGGRRFVGNVSGDRIDARLTGRGGIMGGCAYTLVGDLSASVSGDTMTGQVVWSYDANSSADCGAMATCESVQAMNGSRPPTP
jgi:hypothetical protein